MSARVKLHILSLLIEAWDKTLADFGRLCCATDNSFLAEYVIVFSVLFHVHPEKGALSDDDAPCCQSTQGRQVFSCSNGSWVLRVYGGVSGD